MALRKFSRYMKAVTIFVILAFLFSAVYTGYSSIYGYLQNRKDILFKIEGEKVYKQDFEKKLNEYKKSIQNIAGEKTFNDEFYKKVTFDSFLDETLSNSLSKKLKVKVSSSDVKKELEALKEQYGGEDNFNLLLARNNTNLTILKGEIKKELLAKNTIEKLKEQVKPSDEELKSLYDLFKAENFNNKTFEEAKAEVEDLYYKNKINLIYHSNIENLFLNAKLDTKDEELKTMFEDLKKKEVILDDMYVIGKDMINQYFSYCLNTKSVLNEETIAKFKELKIESMKKLIKTKKIALDKGLKEIDGLNPYDNAVNLQYELFLSFVKEYKPSEEELKDRFNRNAGMYDTENTISGNILGMSYKVSEKDFDNAKKQIEEIKKDITVENFSTYAEKYSTDKASAVNGGDLGEGDLRQYVKEFSEVAKHKENEIVGPIKTQFGYHLVYIVKKDKNDPNKVHLKHILIGAKISEETKEEAKKQVNELVEKIKNKEVSFEDVVNNKDNKYGNFDINTTFSEIGINSSLPIVGYKQEIMQKLFEGEINSVIVEDIKNGVVLIEKTAEVPYKKATFEEMKDRVRLELALEYAQNEILK